MHPPRRTALLALLLAAASPALRAQSPRALRLIVPFTPGGSTDILARALAPRLALALGQPVVIDNKPGVGGSLGAAEAARADPDGHTLLMGHIGTLAVNPALYPKSPYDPVKSFAPVAGVARVARCAHEARHAAGLWCADRGRDPALARGGAGRPSQARLTWAGLLRAWRVGRPRGCWPRAQSLAPAPAPGARMAGGARCPIQPAYIAATINPGSASKPP